jgi:urea transporter
LSFQKGRNLCRFLMYSSALILFAAALINRDLPEVSTGLIVAGFVLCICGAAATIALCRCPHCRRVIILGALNRKDCPHCRRQLVSSKNDGKSPKKR